MKIYHSTTILDTTLGSVYLPIYPSSFSKDNKSWWLKVKALELDCLGSNPHIAKINYVTMDNGLLLYYSFV